MFERHCFRAKWHDYNGGLYFVTICAHEKKHLFGKISESRFYPSLLGEIINEHIENICLYYDDVEILNHVIMPNHVHMIISVGTRLFASNNNFAGNNEDSGNIGCLKPPHHEPPIEDFHHNARLSVIIGAFKAGVTRTARTRKIASLPCWQSRFHEHIIQNQRSFANIMQYIDNNIATWDNDSLNPGS